MAQIQLEFQTTGNDALKKLTEEVAALRAELDKLQGTTKKTRDSESALSAHRKQQVKEMKDYRFVVNEIRDAVNAGTIALNLMSLGSDGNNNSLKAMTNVVNTGFIAFQGMNAIVGTTNLAIKALGYSGAALAGPLGIIISLGGAVAGIIAAIGVESDKSEKSIEDLTAELEQLRFKGGEISRQQLGATLAADYNKAQNELRKLTEVVKKDVPTILGSGAQPRFGLAGTLEEIAKAQVIFQKAANAVRENTSEILTTGRSEKIAELEFQKQIAIEFAKSTINSAEELQRKLLQIELDFLKKLRALKLEEADRLDSFMTPRSLEKSKKATSEINRSIELINAKFVTSEKQRVKDLADTRIDIITEYEANVLSLNTQGQLIAERNSKKRIEIQLDETLKVLELKKRAAVRQEKDPEKARIVTAQFDNKIQEAKNAAILDTKKLEQESALNTIALDKQARDIFLDGLDKNKIALESNLEQRLKLEVEFAKRKNNVVRDSEIEAARLRGATEAEVYAIRKKHAELADNIDADFNTQRILRARESTRQITETLIQGAQQSIGSLFELNSQYNQVRIEAMEREKEERLEAFDLQREGELNILRDQLTNNSLSKAERTRVEKEIKAAEAKAKKERDAVVKEENAKIAAEKTRAWKADRDAKYAMTIIEGARASVAALPNVILAAIIAGLTGIQLGIIASQPVPQFHEGGVVGGTRGRETPILALPGETVRTEKQEAALQARGSTNVYFTFNSPIPPTEWIKNQVQEGMKQSGLTVDQFFVNNNNRIDVF